VQAHQEQPGPDTLVALADAIQQQQGAAAALTWVEAELRSRPTLPGLEKLLALRKALGAGAADSDTELIQRLLAPQAGQALRHVCSHCGFKARQFYWQCPGCSRWDSYPPRRGQGLELAR
jgi:lipopolysaccharide biosynthesis regulator YciM